MKKILALMVLVLLFSCEKEEECKYCKLTTRSLTGVMITQSEEFDFCGEDMLQFLKDHPTEYHENYSIGYECR